MKNTYFNIQSQTVPAQALSYFCKNTLSQTETAVLLAGGLIFRIFDPLCGTEIFCPFVCVSPCNCHACSTCFSLHNRRLSRSMISRNPAVLLLYGRLGTTSPWWTLIFRYDVFDPLCGTRTPCPFVCRLLST